MVPAGKKPTTASRARAPSTTSWGATSWVRSTRRAPGAIPRITPFMAPTNGSRVPKSVVSVMIGATVSPHPALSLKGEGELSPVAVDHVIGDQGEGFQLLGWGKRRQVVLGRSEERRVG